ncbi:MAG: hypothetical protein PHQ61_03070 [Candidatus Omnitrophica bacterium]|nr:hypothetical protein [Candidatus Omnitrophota bacterium]
MNDIISAKFREWTSGRRTGNNIVDIYTSIRDIPFCVVPEFFDAHKGPEGMLLLNKGFCVPKHYLLGVMFGMLGVDVRYCTYAFKWKDIQAVMPSGVKSLADDLPVTYHLACKARINGRWALVDATWDSPLASAGFPVNKNWDGESDTLLAVKHADEVIHDDMCMREDIFNQKMSSYSLPEKLALSRFSMALNKWLDDVRSGKERCIDRSGRGKE